MMENILTIVMYHYVRELPYTRYPKINGLLVSQFREQLKYFEKHYQFVTEDECLNAIYSKGEMPSNALLLTFDDGYIDHFINVFPVLEEKGIQGCFFPPGKPILENKVLDVNKIQFILASCHNIHEIINEIYKLLDNYRSEYALESNEFYFSKYSKYKSSYDPNEIVFIKKLLQFGLKEEIRTLILDKLFRKYVTIDEEGFACELYMNIDQLRCMKRNGMCIGGHGYNHFWMNTLQAKEQEHEIDLTLKLLNEVGSPVDNWIMCYPYGQYNRSLIDVLKKRNCKLALTDVSKNHNIAVLTKNNAFSLARLDTIDFPMNKDQEISYWTKKLNFSRGKNVKYTRNPSF